MRGHVTFPAPVVRISALDGDAVLELEGLVPVARAIDLDGRLVRARGNLDGVADAAAVSALCRSV
ncbi:MAG: hypothetical protein HON70_40060 [Lentisphaerae bacterium]|nr:hypothetical protein [Lentisphaerota bacterium]